MGVGGGGWVWWWHAWEERDGEGWRRGVSTAFRQSCLRGWERPWRGKQLDTSWREIGWWFVMSPNHDAQQHSNARSPTRGLELWGSPAGRMPPSGAKLVERASDGSGWASQMAWKGVFFTLDWTGQSFVYHSYDVLHCILWRKCFAPSQSCSGKTHMTGDDYDIVCLFSLWLCPVNWQQLIFLNLSLVEFVIHNWFNSL